MLCDVINYNDVISATDSNESVKDVRLLKILLSNMSRPETFGMTLVPRISYKVTTTNNDDN